MVQLHGPTATTDRRDVAPSQRSGPRKFGQDCLFFAISFRPGCILSALGRYDDRFHAACCPLAGPIEEVDFGTQYLWVGGGLPARSVRSCDADSRRRTSWCVILGTPRYLRSAIYGKDMHTSTYMQSVIQNGKLDPPPKSESKEAILGVMDMNIWLACAVSARGVHLRMQGLWRYRRPW